MKPLTKIPLFLVAFCTVALQAATITVYKGRWGHEVPYSATKTVLDLKVFLCKQGIIPNCSQYAFSLKSNYSNLVTILNEDLKPLSAYGVREDVYLDLMVSKKKRPPLKILQKQYIDGTTKAIPYRIHEGYGSLPFRDNAVPPKYKHYFFMNGEEEIVTIQGDDPWTIKVLLTALVIALPTFIFAFAHPLQSSKKPKPLGKKLQSLSQSHQ